MADVFRVALVQDFLNSDGQIAMGDIGLDILYNTPGVSVEFFKEYLPEVTPEQINGYDAVISTLPKITERSLSGPEFKLRIVARVGVGYDMVDTQALTNHDVMLTITPDGVRRPMASGIMAFLLSLSHQLFAKDHLLRQGRWKEKLGIKSYGLKGRTLGAIGLGNIGRELFRLAQPFGMIHLASDPFVKPLDVTDLGVRLVGLETLMRESDFVVVICPLTSETRHLVGETELSWMKPTSFFISASRGPVVDQSALYNVLRGRRIAGAALDVFEREPISTDDPLIALDNVILTPHSLCWTDECFRTMGESAVHAVLDTLQGKPPTYVVNRDVLEKPSMLGKLEANRQRWEASRSAQVGKAVSRET